MVTLIIISAINTGAGVILIIAALILFLISLRLSKTKIELIEKKSDIEGVTNSKVIEIVSYPLDIKSRSMEYRVENLMDTMIKERERHTTDFEKQESRFALTLNLVQQLAVTFTVVSSAISVINLEISQGVMAAIILLTNRFFSPFQQAMRTISQWRLNKSYIQRLNAILAMEEPSQNQSAPPPPPHNISYYGVKNYHFTSDKITVISGPSGSGKSSIVNAFTHQLINPNYKILINNEEKEDYYQSSTLNNIILVDKNSTFVDGTIID